MENTLKKISDTLVGTVKYEVTDDPSWVSVSSWGDKHMKDLVSKNDKISIMSLMDSNSTVHGQN